MGAKLFVKNIKNIGDRQVFSAINRNFEVAPEIRQQGFPVERAGRNLIKLAL